MLVEFTRNKFISSDGGQCISDAKTVFNSLIKYSTAIAELFPFCSLTKSSCNQSISEITFIYFKFPNSGSVFFYDFLLFCSQSGDRGLLCIVAIPPDRHSMDLDACVCCAGAKVAARSILNFCQIRQDPESLPMKFIMT